MGSKIRWKTQDETLEQERCARRDAWEPAKDGFKLKNESKDTFYSPAEACVMPAPRATFRDRLWSQGLELRRVGDTQEI